MILMRACFRSVNVSSCRVPELTEPFVRSKPAEPPAKPESAGSPSTSAPAADPPSSPAPTLAEGEEGETSPQPEEPAADQGRQLSCQLVNSSWCGLLAALSVLLEAR